MQKLDFNEAIIEIRKLLKSDDILQFFMNLKTNPVNTNALTPLIIESKSNFDRISTESNQYKILTTLGANDLYAGEGVGTLINHFAHTTISQKSIVDLYANRKILEFYHFHFSIVKAAELSTNVLFEENQIELLNAKDIVIFRVLVTDNNLTITTYNKILVLINEIIEIINKVIEAEEEIQPKIILLDSGSDVNIGIKSTLEIATALFQIFKEVWDWIINRKFYKNKLRNAALLDNLKVMIAIKDAEQKGAIDSNTAKGYRETLIRKTEDLLELKVLPLQLVENKTEISSRKVLSEFSEIKLLESDTKSKD